MIEHLIAAGVVTGFAALGVLLFILIRRRPSVSPDAARAVFIANRADLERQFFAAASTTGKPRGLIWKSSELGDELELARDRRSGELLALASVTIAFEAVPGSDMEGLPAVSNLRSATAVFVWREGGWTTAGRTVFNLAPAETLKHFAQQYDAVATG